MAGAVALIALLALIPLKAEAAPYVARACAPAAPGHDFTLDFNPEQPGAPTEGFSFANQCGVAGIVLQAPVNVTSTGGVRWILHAPADTRITSIDLERDFEAEWSVGFRWELMNEIGEVVDFVQDNPPPPSDRVEYPIDVPDPNLHGSVAVAGRLGCRIGQQFCKAISAPARPRVAVRVPEVVLDDALAPTEATIVDTGLTGPLRGTSVPVTFSAADRGSGIRKAFLLVDGVAHRTLSVCPLPADGVPLRLQPCPLSVPNAQMTLNTTAFKDGDHSLTVVVEDVSGQSRGSAPVTIKVRNAPVNNGRPTIAGAARVGSPLTATEGTWSNDPTAFAYRWLRCPNDFLPGQEGRCASIANAVQRQYTPVQEDVGSRLVVQVVASNQSGEDRSFSLPTDPVGDPRDQSDRTSPTLRNASLTRKSFRASKAGAPIKARVGARGTTLRFNSSEAGQLSLRFAKASKPAKALATLTRKIGAGSAKLGLSGRLNGKALTPGRYRLTLTATDAAGNASKPTHLSFRILRG